jgi:hypothetical protein
MRLFATVGPYRWSIRPRGISGSIQAVKKASVIILMRRSECSDIAKFAVRA